MSQDNEQTNYLNKRSTGEWPAAKRDTSTQRQVPRQIRLYMPAHAAVLDAPLRGSLMLGRRTSQQEGQVDVDFTPFNASDYGISRYHAIIEIQDGLVIIRDLGSTNGTYLNGEVLTARAPYRLRHGDELMLGTLHIQVHFALASAQAQTDMLTSEDNAHTMLERIRGFRWNGGFTPHADSASAQTLMQEFLRRMLLWARATGSREWPLFDVAKAINPSSRADAQHLSSVTSGLFPNVLVRVTCGWLLHWAMVENTREVQAFDLPSPYEPLIQLYERGAWFQRSGDHIEVWDPPASGYLPLSAALYDRLMPFTEMGENQTGMLGDAPA